MGLMGILYPLITGGASIARSIRDWKSNSYNSKHRQHPNGMTYTDREGRSRRMVGSNRIAVYHGNAAGDRCLYDAETHEMICNFSQAQSYSFMHESKREAIKKGLTAYYCEDSSFCNDIYHRELRNTNHSGRRYKDIETDHLLVEKTINGFIYFFDIDDDCVLRLSDSELEYRRKDPERATNKWKGPEFDIEEFNRKRKEFKDKYFSRVPGMYDDPNDRFDSISDEITFKNIYMSDRHKYDYYINVDPFVISKSRISNDYIEELKARERK